MLRSMQEKGFGFTCGSSRQNSVRTSEVWRAWTNPVPPMVRLRWSEKTIMLSLQKVFEEFPELGGLVS